MIRACGAQGQDLAGPLEQVRVPAYWRTSSSFISTMSTRPMASVSASLAPSIQKFIESSMVTRGRRTCSSTASCSTGSMLARKTRSASRKDSGSRGWKSLRTLSWVSRVSRRLRSKW